jgi:23S rRNA (guanosine2251-2'-O)-methyltransferase
MDKSEYIFGIRAVMEAIQAGRDIDKVLIRKDLQGDLIGELLQLVKAHRVVTRRVPVQTIDRITRKNHQGVVAVLSAVTYHRLDYLVPALYEEGRLPFIIVLDGLTDVRNFGAIARTAECVGADAIVIPEHGSVSVGGDAVKTSAGALLHLPVCRERSAALAVKFLKDNGYKVVAVTEKASTPYTQIDYTTPVALVMGAEDVGISPEVLKLTDAGASIPMFGQIGSLNVSVAAGVMMYEVVRQRLNSNLNVE